MNFETEIFGRDDIDRVPETVCAFANSSGGEISCKGFDPLSLIPPGVPYVRETSGSVYIPPLEWHKKPVTLDGKVYRRIEGVNVISGLLVKSIMAGDSNEASRDDFPFSARLNDDDVDAFTAKVVELHGDMKRYSRAELLRRVGVYAGKYLTFAGALMLGDILRISASLEYFGGHAEIEAANIWRAYTEILPRLTFALSENCAKAFREAFVNSLLHADYNVDNHITIAITSSPPTVTFDNPGMIRWTARNHRLAKMFALSGITGGNFHGLDIIRSYIPNFELTQDMLNIRTISTLPLEGHAELPEPVML